jgi:hypothetical protein
MPSVALGKGFAKYFMAFAEAESGSDSVFDSAAPPALGDLEPPRSGKLSRRGADIV